VVAPLIVPDARLDVLVDRAADGARRRLTTYTGQVRCDARTAVLGASAWGPLRTYEHAWALPDSLPYRADRLGDAEVHVSVAPLAVHDTFDTTRVAAAFTPDADQIHAWVLLDLVLSTRSGAIATYRIDVLAAPDAVDEPGRS
jgi:hypothetical protein